MDTYVYEYGSGLYVNLTNRCNNNCAFCLRHTNQGVGSHRLWLEHEPTAEQVIEKMQDLSAVSYTHLDVYKRQVSTLRPLRRLRATTLAPVCVFMRARKPCTFLRCLFFG